MSILWVCDMELFLSEVCIPRYQPSRLSKQLLHNKHLRREKASVPPPLSPPSHKYAVMQKCCQPPSARLAGLPSLPQGSQEWQRKRTGKGAPFGQQSPSQARCLASPAGLRALGLPWDSKGFSCQPEQTVFVSMGLWPGPGSGRQS